MRFKMFQWFSGMSDDCRVLQRVQDKFMGAWESFREVSKGEQNSKGSREFRRAFQGFKRLSDDIQLNFMGVSKNIEDFLRVRTILEVNGFRKRVHLFLKALREIQGSLRGFMKGFQAEINQKYVYENVILNLILVIQREFFSCACRSHYLYSISMGYGRQQ